MRVTTGVRRVLSWICWALAVATGVLTGGAFAGGGVLCERGTRAACTPQTWLLVLGVALTVGLGAAGAVLYRPRSRPEPRYPWDYRR